MLEELLESAEKLGADGGVADEHGCGQELDDEHQVFPRARRLPFVAVSGRGEAAGQAVERCTARCLGLSRELEPRRTPDHPR
jgi:hypothetical protein